MPSKLRKVRFWTGIKSLKMGIGLKLASTRCMKNIYVYTHMFTFADEPPDIWITFGAIYKSTSFHGKKFTSFTNNFTKRQIIESSVFSICFPLLNTSRKFLIFLVRIQGKSGVYFPFSWLYWDGSAHSLFPRQIVVVLHKGWADPLAEISFRAKGIASAWLLIQTKQKF